MKNHTTFTKSTALLLSCAILLASCSSTTMITSTPPGAKVYIDGAPVGTTPYTHRDAKIVGSTTTLKLEKDGYDAINTTFARDEEVDVGALISGIFFWIPFLWTMKYRPVHNYELSPSASAPQPAVKPAVAPKAQPTGDKSKADRLRELKELLDEKVLTQEEYEKEKKKILAEDE